MNRSVQASPEQLRRIRSEIQRSRQDINNAARRINASLNNASKWQDPVRIQFEQDLKHALTALKKFDTDSEQLCATLEKKAQQLDTFLGKN